MIAPLWEGGFFVWKRVWEQIKRKVPVCSELCCLSSVIIPLRHEGQVHVLIRRTLGGATKRAKIFAAKKRLTYFAPRRRLLATGFRNRLQEQLRRSLTLLTEAIGAHQSARLVPFHLARRKRIVNLSFSLRSCSGR